MKIARGRTRGGQTHIQPLKPKQRKRVTDAGIRDVVRVNLGQKTDQMRRYFGLSIPQLATVLGWTTGDVVNLIAGKMTPSAGQHADLARWLAASRRNEQVTDHPEPQPDPCQK